MASVAAELLKGDDGSDANRRRRLETIVAHATRSKPPTKGDRSASERA